MIPHQMQIKNFLSYGTATQTISFDPYHLIYLSGKNGHGKSALLDALTWSIWGSARKTLTSVKPDLGLIKLGQSHMFVAIEFSCNNHRYKIRREITISNHKNQLHIEFGIFDKNKEQWLPLTEKTTKDTQSKIEKTIGISYDSFINSAFLKQGCSNEFSKKSAKDRKEIFAQILGLTDYETIKIKALQKTKIEQARLQTIEQFIIQASHIISTKKAIEEAHQTEKNEKSNVEQKLNILEEQCQKNNFLMKTYELQLAEHETQLQTKNVLTDEKKHLDRTIVLRYQTIQKKKKTILQSDSIPQLIEQQKIYMQELETHHNATNFIVETQSKLLQIESAIYHKEQEKNNAFHSLQEMKKELAILQQKQLDLTQMLTNMPDEYACQRAQNEQINLIKKKDQLQKLLDRKKEIYHTLVIFKKNSQTEYESIQKKLTFITNHQEDPSCPLCLQNLSIMRKKFLQNRLNNESEQIQRKFSKAHTLILNYKLNLIKLHEKITSLNQTIILQETTLNLLKEQIKEKTKLQSIKEEITNKEHSFAIVLQNAEKEFELKWNTNDSSYTNLYNEKKKLQQELIDIQTIQMKNGNLQKNISVIHEKIHRCQEFIQEYKKDRQALLYLFEKRKQTHYELSKTTIAVNEELLTEYNNLKTIITEQTNEIVQLKNIKNAIEERYISYAAKLQEVINASEKHEHLIHEKETLEEHIRDYQYISYAASKDGIQALLIEDAIPEVENEANMLLSKLTNNQTQLFIESLKDLKNGGTKETLDIKISDAMGIRPYEMFSGGEAFRIDLALRIGISKLLAKRAGTALQTLIIDEGFGSQDDDGLNAIMDAMYKIQDDFAKIIIVSHLPIMKDQFPVHFVVEKKPQGSIISIKELC